MKKFYIRKPPEIPIRSTDTIYLTVYRYSETLTLIDLLRQIPPEIPLENVMPYINHDGRQIGFKFESLESESSFRKRMTRYNNELKKYNEWKEKNKEKIEQELEIQKQVKEKADQYRTEIKKIRGTKK